MKEILVDSPDEWFESFHAKIKSKKYNHHMKSCVKNS